MEIAVENDPSGATVLRVSGRLDLLSASVLRDAVRRRIGQGDVNVVIDLSGVPYVDSSGIGALIGGLRAAREAGGELRIAAPAEQVVTVLELTTVNRILSPYASVEEALDGL